MKGRRRSRALEASIDMAWSQWCELGVQGTPTKRLSDTAVDPEALILFTASIGDAEPRLRDEAMGWCAANGQLISSTRLARMREGFGDADRGNLDSMLAGICVKGAPWGKAAPSAGRFRGKGGLKPCDLGRPSLARLRLRALFGVGARSEVLWAFLATGEAERAAAGLAAETGFTKRSVLVALDLLERGGVLDMVKERNQYIYRLRDPGELRSFCGKLPDRFPRWVPVMRVVAAMLRALAATESLGPDVRAVELRAALERMKPDLGAARLPLPDAMSGPEFLAGFESWAERIAEGL